MRPFGGVLFFCLVRKGIERVAANICFYQTIKTYEERRRIFGEYTALPRARTLYRGGDRATRDSPSFVRVFAHQWAIDTRAYYVVQS